MAWPGLTAEQRRMVRRLSEEGLSLRQVARQVSCSHQTAWLVLRSNDGRSARSAWEPAEGRLSVADREEISLGVYRGETFSAIASRLGRATSTVSREVAANGGRAGYQAWRAPERAREQARRPKRPKLACPRLAAQVTAWLEEWWSPEEIARRLRIEFPTDPMMWVSHETIYQALFVQGRGELRRELARCVRTGRAARRRRGRRENPGRIPGMVMISDRPPEAADRAVPGHWEGDLIVGKASKSAVGTGRTHHPLSAVVAPARRQRRPGRRRGDAHGHRHPARPAGPQHHLGPGQGDVPPRRLHHRHRHRRLLL